MFSTFRSFERSRSSRPVGECSRRAGSTRRRSRSPRPASVSTGWHLHRAGSDSTKTACLGRRSPSVSMPAGQEPGWVVGEIALEELWRYGRSRPRWTRRLCSARRRGTADDRPRQPEQEAHVVATDAPGQSRTPELDLRRRSCSKTEARRRASATNTPTTTGRIMLAVATQVHKPTVGRYRRTTDRRGLRAGHAAFGRQLLIAIGLALLGTVILGWFWGRSFITRIFALTRATQAIADGRMDERVASPARTRSGSLATPSTPWLTASCSFRRTSGARNARRCSARSPPAWCTTSRTRFRPSSPIPNSSFACLTMRSIAIPSSG